jgi:hypothetical protein
LHQRPDLGSSINSTSAFKRHQNEIRTKFWIKKQPQSRVGEKTTNSNSLIFLEQEHPTQVGLWAAETAFSHNLGKVAFLSKPRGEMVKNYDFSLNSEPSLGHTKIFLVVSWTPLF